MAYTYKNHVIAFCIILCGLLVGGTVFFLRRDVLEVKSEKIFDTAQKNLETIVGETEKK